jgi:hypothetical protein
MLSLTPSYRTCKSPNSTTCTRPISRVGRVTWILVWLLWVLAGRSTLAKVFVSTMDERSFHQSTGTAQSGSVRLTDATIRMTETEWDFSIVTEAPGDLGLFHIYLDTDADASTGYQPPSRRTGELGADYLVEGGTLHTWSGGDDHAAWKWKPLDSVKISRGPSGEIQVALPLGKLRLAPGTHPRVLIETLTEKWESADTLPRDGIWDTQQPNLHHAEAASPRPAVTGSQAPAKIPTEGSVIEQVGNPSTAKSASLVRASAHFEADTLVVEARSEAEPSLNLYHVYLDSDLNSSTGYRSTKAARGLGGADFLCEGEFLYAWDGGEDHSAWRWRKVAPIIVTRSDQGGLRVSIPRDRLNLRGKKAVQILIETIDEKWQARDTLPRTGTWVVNLP